MHEHNGAVLRYADIRANAERALDRGAVVALAARTLIALIDERATLQAERDALRGLSTALLATLDRTVVMPHNGPESSPALPDTPHPLAADTGKRLHGDVVWHVGDVDCVELQRISGARFLQSIELCPLHLTPWFLAPSMDVTAWSHGRGRARCLRLVIAGSEAAHHTKHVSAGGEG